MTARDFFDTFEGLWVETNKGMDTSTLDQCVDLWRAYNQKVIGGPFMTGNATDFWMNYPTDFYDKIPNASISDVPQLGDVIIWGTKYSKFGHIAICTDIANTKTFTSFDQNDPTGTPCHYQPHTYTGVLGWLRPKNQTSILGQPQLEQPAEASADTQIQGYKNFIDDLIGVIKPPEDKKDFAGLLGRTQELKLLADSIPAIETKRQTFISGVAKGIGCAEASEKAVLEVLVDLEAHISAIKTQRLEEFGAGERIISGFLALFRRK